MAKSQSTHNSLAYLVALTAPSTLEELDQALVYAADALCTNSQTLIYKGNYSKSTERNILSAKSINDDEAPASYPHSLMTTVLCQRDRTTIRSVIISSSKPPQSNKLLANALQIYQNQVHHINQASLDKLTGLLTRDLFEFYIQKIYQELRHNRRARDQHGHFAVAFVDIDDFKKINDHYGHLIGDEVLLLIAQIMKQTFRTDDLLFRFGGEEFIIILRNCSINSCRNVLNRFRKEIEKFPFPLIEHITVSIGFALIDSNYNYDILINRADKALYYVKKNGKNGCCNYEELVMEKSIEPLVSIEGDVELF